MVVAPKISNSGATITPIRHIWLMARTATPLKSIPMATLQRSFTTRWRASLTLAKDGSKLSKVGKFLVQLRCPSCLNLNMKCYHLSFPSSITICLRNLKRTTFYKDSRIGFNNKEKNSFLLWQINFIMPQAAIKILQPFNLPVPNLNKGALTCGSGPSRAIAKVVCKV